jgi:hypothetical protein
MKGYVSAKYEQNHIIGFRVVGVSVAIYLSRNRLLFGSEGSYRNSVMYEMRLISQHIRTHYCYVCRSSRYDTGAVSVRRHSATTATAGPSLDLADQKKNVFEVESRTLPSMRIL